MSQHPYGVCAPARDHDAQRELSRAAERILRLEKALKDIASAPCDANPSLLASTCMCCLHDRMLARAALEGIE